MFYYIGQGMGIAATVCCILIPLFQKKWQMSLCRGLANVFLALNLVFIGQLGSAVIVNFLLVVQSGLSIWHVTKEKPVSKVENILFLVAFVGLGLIGFRSFLDLLPIAGAVFSMLSIFQPNEQRTRLLLFFNAICFFSYYVVVGSTSMFAELFTIISSATGMIKYRKKH